MQRRLSDCPERGRLACTKSARDARAPNWRADQLDANADADASHRRSPRRNLDVGCAEVSSLEEQRQIFALGEGVGHAVAEIEPRLVTDFAEAHETVAGEDSLFLIERDDGDQA